MRIMRLHAIVTAVLACPGLVYAQPPDRATLIDPRAVAGFADEFFPTEMARRQIPGSVFVFVSEGELAVARGFGVAQVESRRPVDPNRTRFRLASVSKTITATAALQLVEQGRLDLHRSVNDYLDTFKLGEARGSITLHHLLTHTAGFDERLTGMAARSAVDIQDLGDYLARSMPPTFIAPGHVISYSNHGFGLIGLLVQEQSGRPFADYVQERIFEPLGMTQTGSLIGPVPDNLAVAYDVAGGRLRPLSPEYLQISPAGAFFTTGADMGRFMIAHLRGGAYQDRRILRPETVALMHQQHFVQAQGTSGWAYGLWEDARNGQRALLHNGGGKGYRALMYLLPQQDAGFFLAYNLADRHEDGELQEAFITEFRRRFVPRIERDTMAVAGRPALERLVGDYLYVRRARTTIETFISAVNRVSITPAENDALTMTGAFGGPMTLTPIGPFLFRRADDRGVVAFNAMNGSAAQRLVLVADSGFPAVFERVPFVATLRAQLMWIAGMALAFGYAAAWRPIAARLRRRTHGAGWDARRWAIWLGGMASALNLLFLAGFPLVFLGRIEGGFPDFVYGVPILARLLLLIPPVTTVVGIAVCVAVVALWRDERSSITERIAHALVAFALLGFIGFAWYWKLLAAVA